MSYNSNLYNNFQGNFTFHGNYHPIPPPNFSFPPPPPPPSMFIPSIIPQQTDQDFIKSFATSIIKSCKAKKQKSISISIIREKIVSLVLTLDDLKKTEYILQEGVNSLSDEEWKAHMNKIEIKKESIKRILESVSDEYLDTARKLLTKRSSKRLRLKRVKGERKRENQERIQQMQERSRKIDENLKKIKDDIEKAKQETEAKLHADVVLKEVMRKKNDAKKCITKLDGLVRLRKARLNTAKGRGVTVSENETTAFNSNIEKLKLLWSQKLAIYEKEESDLRATLKQSVEEKDLLENETEKEVIQNLKKWQELLFGKSLPQVDFNGDVEKFVARRCQWDQFICNEGTALPVGWVVPKLED
ncbi:unnamed protein product [Parnassius apollo]|uniref:(apollo) hypothetical protein n=1 Tax=Parnassius apollo TaxID=110799 RepID=A0A8S3YBS1_PARAO|nr:unnamed protein product [Parnassius apollo]